MWTRNRNEIVFQTEKWLQIQIATSGILTSKKLGGLSAAKKCRRPKVGSPRLQPIFASRSTATAPPVHYSKSMSDHRLNSNSKFVYSPNAFYVDRCSTWCHALFFFYFLPKHSRTDVPNRKLACRVILYVKNPLFWIFKHYQFRYSGYWAPTHFNTTLKWAIYK